MDVSSETCRYRPRRGALVLRVLAVLVVGLAATLGSGLRAADEPVSEPIPLSQPDAARETPPSAGNKAAPVGIPTNPTEIVLVMGWWMVPFAAASIVALWFAIERLVVLRRSRVIPGPFVDRFLQHLEQGLLDRESALSLCEQNRSPVAAVFAHGIRKWGKPSVEVEQAIIDGGERQVSQLRKHLRVLNGVATVTPLLGLLGTVVGMIQAFNQLATAAAMGHPERLAVGIAIALLTTAFGLAIAIPSLIMYLYLVGRVDLLVGEMDYLAQNVVHLVCAENLVGPSVSVPRRRGHDADPPAAESKKAV